MWVRLDDSFADHPKILAAGPLAALVQVRALCYSARHLTDGFIPDQAMLSLAGDLDTLLAPDDDPFFSSMRAAAEMTEAMIKGRLWDKVPGGFMIHDYLDYHPSRSTVLQDRARKAEAGRAGGLAKHLALARASASAPPVAEPVASARASASSRTRTRTRTRPSPSTKATTTPLSGTPDASINGHPDWGKPEHLVALYNRVAPPECPKVDRLSPARRDKARKYLAAFPEREFWTSALSELKLSRFLRGQGVARPGHEHFRADLDWLLSRGKDGTENVVKVNDGKYRDPELG